MENRTHTLETCQAEYIIAVQELNQTTSTPTVIFKQWRRQLANKIIPPLVWGMIRLIWKTCKLRQVVGQAHLQTQLDEGNPFIPCYWHQQQIFSIRYLLDTANANPTFNLGYLISPSADGDIATNMFANQGVHIIRGSATRGGAQALREIYTAIRKQRISPIVTPDGPTGPIYQCKPGVAMLAQLSGAPLVPMSYAASRSWQLRSWDKFILPVPFSSIVVGIGEPLYVDKSLAKDNFTQACQLMNERLNSISALCQEKLMAAPGQKN